MHVLLALYRGLHRYNGRMKKIYIAGGVLLSAAILCTSYVAYDRNLEGFFAHSSSSAALVLTSTETNTVASWIKKLQYSSSRYESYGAITVSDGVAVYEDGTERPLRRVTPYFSHLGVLGVLDSKASGSLTVAKRWITWYVRHLDPVAGVPLDTWYSVDGTYGTTCPVANDERQCRTIDAEDSSAALFLVVVDSYVAKGGSQSFVRDNRTAIRAVTDTMMQLVDTDGLSWAKETYPIKYLMDNVEVLAGIEAAARLERTVFRNTTRANELTRAADKLRIALHGSQSGSMFNASTNLYAVYKDGAGTQGASNMTTWYPDLMAQIWPVAFGQRQNIGAYTKAVAAVASQVPADTLQKGNCAALVPVTASAHAPVLAYVLRKENYPGASALTKCMYKQMQPSFAWPVTVADAGWLLRR